MSLPSPRKSLITPWERWHTCGKAGVSSLLLDNSPFHHFFENPRFEGTFSLWEIDFKFISKRGIWKSAIINLGVAIWQALANWHDGSRTVLMNQQNSDCQEIQPITQDGPRQLHCPSEHLASVATLSELSPWQGFMVHNEAGNWESKNQRHLSPALL